MIGEPLFDSKSIADRVAVIGEAISRDYAGQDPAGGRIALGGRHLSGRPDPGG